MPRKNKSSGPAAPGPLAGPQRLNKLLAAAGLGSRREVEQYILDGRVEVDGQPVTDLATKVDSETAAITFDGSAIKIFRPVYFALNKPVGVLSTNRDPSGRMRAIDLVNVKERIFSAGRLDKSSEGLMLLTNDGELVQRLSHPRYGVQKLYLATVQGEITQADLEKLTRGVRLAEGYAKVDAVKLRKQRSGAADLEVALSEGKNREIRRILARLGHKVVGLKRLAIGPLRLGQLPTGGWRPLTKHEIQALYEAALSGRRKKRGTSKLPRKNPRPGKTDESIEPTLSAGQFDRYGDDDYDEDFGPSLDEMSDDELGGDDELLLLNESSLKGSIIPYDEEEEETEDDSDLDDSPSDEQGDDAPVRRRGPRESRPRSNSTRSPHDLRNRKSASSDGRSSGSRGERSAPKSGRGFQGARGSRPSSSSSRGPKKAAGRPIHRSGTGPSSRPSEGRSSEGRSSESRPTRSPGPRAGSSRTGLPRSGGPKKSGPPRSGPSRGPGKSGPGKSGPSRGGPTRGSGGPGRGGPRGSGPRGSGPGRGGPGKGGPGKGRGGGKR